MTQDGLEEQITEMKGAVKVQQQRYSPAEHEMIVMKIMAWNIYTRRSSACSASHSPSGTEGLRHRF
jgi:hypothetical protein